MHAGRKFAAPPGDGLDIRIPVVHRGPPGDGGFATGRSMLGQHEDYDVIPYFFSDQYDTGLEYARHIPHGAPTELVMRGEPTEGAFMAFWLTEDLVLAGMHVNEWDTIDDVKTPRY